MSDFSCKELAVMRSCLTIDYGTIVNMKARQIAAGARERGDWASQRSSAT